MPFLSMVPRLLIVLSLASLTVLSGCQTTGSTSQAEYTIKIQKGDTLAAIAHRFDTTPLAIVRLNGLKKPVRLQVGQSLRIIPGPSGHMAGRDPIMYSRGAASSIKARFSNTGAADPREFSEADFPHIEAQDLPSSSQNQGQVKKSVLAPQDSQKNHPQKAAPTKAGPKSGLFFSGGLKESADSRISGLASNESLEDFPDRQLRQASDPLIEEDLLGASPPLSDELLALEPLRWPVRGSITSHFGLRGGRPHKGVDIQAPHGSQVASAAEGRVIFAGNKRRYGKVVILQHRYFQTLYAHLSAVKVRKGEWVDLRRVIGLVGASGNARGTHLHFEVIDSSAKPVDPVAVMAKSHSFRLAKISGDGYQKSKSSTRIQ